jgi:acetyl-CoA C-acetyltransferase
MAGPAGLRDTTRATLVNKVCASGSKAVALAAQSITLGHSVSLAAAAAAARASAHSL